MIKVNLSTMEAVREPVPSFLPDDPDLLKNLHRIDPNYGLQGFAWWPTIHADKELQVNERYGQEVLTADRETETVYVTHYVEQIPAEELAAEAEAKSLQFQAYCVQRAQEDMDNFARTRNYDGILSACSYATSSIPRFRDEGNRAVYLRDLTWSTLYQSAADVMAGIKPMPESYEDIGLPVLTWEEPAPQEPV